MNRIARKPVLARPSCMRGVVITPRALTERMIGAILLLAFIIRSRARVRIHSAVIVCASVEINRRRRRLFYARGIAGKLNPLEISQYDDCHSLGLRVVALPLGMPKAHNGIPPRATQSRCEMSYDLVLSGWRFMMLISSRSISVSMFALVRLIACSVAT